MFSSCKQLQISVLIDRSRHLMKLPVPSGKLQVIDPIVETQQYSRSMCLEYCEIEYILLKCKCIKNDPAVKIHPELTENYKYCRSNKKTNCSDTAIEDKTNVDWQVSKELSRCICPCVVTHTGHISHKIIAVECSHFLYKLSDFPIISTTARTRTTTLREDAVFSFL